MGRENSAARHGFVKEWLTMSNCTYDHLWREAMTDLMDLLEMELTDEIAKKEKMDPANAKKGPEPGSQEEEELREEEFQQKAAMYIRYIQVYKNLEDCYDQMIHPQKREDIKMALENCIGQLINTKYDLVLNQQTDYVCLDDIIVDLKLTPDALEMRVPRYFRDDRDADIKKREELMNTLLVRFDIPPEEDDHKVELPTRNEAILILQRNERARQSRQRATFMKQLREQEALALAGGAPEPSEKMPRMDTEMAALVIQKIFRGYKTRLASIRADKQELIFLRMAADDLDGEDYAEQLEKETRQRRKHRQKEYQRLYKEHTDQMRVQLYDEEGPEIKEDISTAVSTWYFKYRVKFKDWPQELSDYYDPEKNGENMPETLPEEDGGAKKKEKKKKDDDGPSFEESQFVKKIQEATVKYQQAWERKEEKDNFEQKHDPQLIREALMPETVEKVKKETLVALLPELEQ